MRDQPWPLYLACARASDPFYNRISSLVLIVRAIAIFSLYCHLHCRRPEVNVWSMLVGVVGCWYIWSNWMSRHNIWNWWGGGKRGGLGSRVPKIVGNFELTWNRRAWGSRIFLTECFHEAVSRWGLQQSSIIVRVYCRRSSHFIVSSGCTRTGVTGVNALAGITAVLWRDHAYDTMIGWDNVQLMFSHALLIEAERLHHNGICGVEKYFFI